MTMTQPGPVDTFRMSGGNRVATTDFKRRREALGITAERFYKMARVSRRALHNAEGGTAGPVVTAKVANTLARLEAGETVPEDVHVLRVEIRPGVYLTVDASDEATLGDLRDVESRVRRLIDSDPT